MRGRCPSRITLRAEARRSLEGRPLPCSRPCSLRPPGHLRCASSAPPGASVGLTHSCGKAAIASSRKAAARLNLGTPKTWRSLPWNTMALPLPIRENSFCWWLKKIHSSDLPGDRVRPSNRLRPHFFERPARRVALRPRACALPGTLPPPAFHLRFQAFRKDLLL